MKAKQNSDNNPIKVGRSIKNDCGKESGISLTLENVKQVGLKIYKWRFFYLMYTNTGRFWFRLFGIGFSFKDITRNELLFSQRNKYCPWYERIRIGKWIIRFLRYAKIGPAVIGDTIIIPKQYSLENGKKYYIVTEYERTNQLTD